MGDIFSRILEESNFKEAQKKEKAQSDRIAALEEDNRKLREALEKIRDMKYPEDDWDEPGMDAVEIATAALGGEG